MSTDNTETINKIKLFAQSFGIGAVAQATNLPELLAALRGEGPAPTWLTTVSREIKRLAGTPAANQVLTGVLTTVGVTAEEVASLFRAYAPFVGVEVPEGAADEAVHTVLATLAERIGSEDGPRYEVLGVTRCPQCKYTYLLPKPQGA